MLLAAMLVNALHAALEDRIEALDRIRVVIAAHVFLGLVVDRVVAAFEFLADLHVNLGLVGFEPAVSAGIGDQDGADRLGRGAVDVKRAGAAVSFNQRQDGMLVAVALLAIDLAVATDF